MGLFRQIYKSTRLSHLLLGIVAICALPSIDANASESGSRPISVQQVIPFYQLANKRLVVTKNLQYFCQSQEQSTVRLQAVTSIEFFAKNYQLNEVTANPIRAGP
ncbi:secA translation cis-regulator SecM [Pasteurella skyensis]|nr:secA translation cis-regulator SecM [Pasteurella skyensis]MDP8163028.1 secA translation cis-regulator SecM [Pasteurella skyensis]MDP8173111.1 secA translation cis-regulator SecM [Pasteurella skyensis]MDP8176334.1 secA translation cis-regulator SecM [Pasteurella skyensis]MDP8178956.1 secA translation cis-regulator SecM [Pasteurella skyensis]MDP8183725.1 secA translation cis-regulator SecM [Pasteurella skyensis]